MSRKKKKVTASDSTQRNRNFTMMSTTGVPAAAESPPSPLPEPTPVHYKDAFPDSKHSSPIVVDMSPKSFESSSLEDGLRAERRRRPPWLSLIGGLYFLLLMLSVLGAIFIIVAGITIVSQQQLQADETIFFISRCLIILGGVYLVIAMLGVAAGSRRSRILAIIFVVLLAAYMGAHVWTTMKMTENIDAAKDTASATWESLTDPQRKAVQDTMKCCGFADTGDRNFDPCPADASAGCGESLATFARQFHRALFIGLWTALGVNGMLIIFILIIAFVHNTK